MANRSMVESSFIGYNKGLNPVVNFNFILRVELAFDLPCKSVKAFTRENEYEFIQEGGLNDYVHMRRKPISKPFTFDVERYVGVEYFDPLPNGAELALPVILIVCRHAHELHFPTMWARRYAFTGCTVMKKTYGELNAEQSGLMTETTTIAFREMLIVDTPFYDAFDYIPNMHKNWTKPADRPEDESEEHLKMRKDMQDLEKELNKLNGDKSNLERERKAIEKELTDLNKKKNENDKKLNDARNKVTDTEKAIEKLKEALENNDKEVEKKKEALIAVEKAIKEHEERIALLDEQLAGLQEMLKNAKSSSEKVRIENEIKRIQDSREPDMQALQALKNDLTLQTNSLEELPKEKERIENEIKAEQKNLQKAKADLDKAVKDHPIEAKRIEEAIKETQERFKEKNAEITAKNGEIDKQKKEIENQRKKMKEAKVVGY
jgi:predicted  nucleic acid-binding Zn-ribbon protein